MLTGAVYSPVLLMVPAPTPVSDQVTDVFGAFVTAAVNCCVCEIFNVTLVGLMLTPTGTSVTVALADLVGSASDVAFTVMFCWLTILAGAV